MSHEKTSVVLKKISRAAEVRGMKFEFKRFGGNHLIYELDGRMVPISKPKVTRVETTYRQLQPVLGKGWWRE